MDFRDRMAYPLRMLMLCAVVVGAAYSAAMPAHAYDSDAALEADGVLCSRQVSRAERKYAIPQRLLGAIAATETGRLHRGTGVKVPWPWSINVEGKPFLFHTKREAVIAVEEFQARGIKSIDVGCMQINLYHHPHAFSSLSQAFEPSFNVDYAARFLLGHYRETGSWKTAVGRYHSRTPGHAARYVGLVYGQWYGLAAKQQTAPPRRNRYKSYIRMEDTGEQKNLSNRGGHVITAATPQPDVVTSNARVVRPSTQERSAGRMDISIIRPAASAGKIESTPTVNVAKESDAVLMHRTRREKDFTTPKLVSIHEGNTQNGEDSRFIRFVD